MSTCWEIRKSFRCVLQEKVQSSPISPNSWPGAFQMYNLIFPLIWNVNNFHRRQRNPSANNICFWQFVSLIMMINIHYLATAQRNVLLHVFVPSGGMEKVGLLQKEILPSIHIILVTHPIKWWESPLFPSPMGRMFGYDSENILFAFGPTRTKDKAEARRMHKTLGLNWPFSQHWVSLSIWGRCIYAAYLS